MTTDIKKYTFKEGLPQEFEIVGLAEFYEGFKNIITAAHLARFYHIIWFLINWLKVRYCPPFPEVALWIQKWVQP